MVALSASIASAQTATLSRQLELGMSGSDVSALQTFLASDVTLYPEGLITGYFGPLTQAAVMRFQRQKGISPVGRVGPQTLAALGNLADNTRKVGTDRNAPIISNVNLGTTNSSASISWRTSEPSSAIVYYDTSPLRTREADATNGVSVSGSSMIESIQLTSSHNAEIDDLRSSDTYYYLIYARDASGNVSLTWPSTFQTD